MSNRWSGASIFVLWCSAVTVIGSWGALGVLIHPGLALVGLAAVGITAILSSLMELEDCDE